MSFDASGPVENQNGQGPRHEDAGLIGPDEAPTLRNRPKKTEAKPGADQPNSPPAPEANLSGLIRSGPVTALLTSPLPPVPLMRLKVLRGLKVNTEYSIYEGNNMIGRGDDKPVDIDVRDQEPRDHVWASRNHAIIHFSDGQLTVEDLNSMNGTYVNRHRVYPGQKRTLRINDVLQIGTVQLKVTA